jgi:carbamoyl-phosphate synthase large subunit
MKTVLFIAGGIWQMPFVKYLKEKGHRLAIVNPVATETTNLADIHIQCDIGDLETINKNIEKIRPEFITSDQSDISTSIVAELSQKWGLPGNSPDVIRKFTNKYSMYEFGSSIGVPVPYAEIVSSVDHIKEFGNKYGYPIIIKPVDSTMSRGFRKFDNESEVSEKTLESSLSFSKSKRAVVQKFVFGDMVTLEGVCSGGKHRTIATSRKRHYFKAGITSGVRYPSDYPDSIINKMIEANDKYVEMSGLNFGLTHSEYLVDDEFFLLEIGARGGGASITDKIVPWSSGIKTYDILYESLMGEVLDVKSLNILKKPALLKYYQEDEVNEKQADKIRKIKGVSLFCHNFTRTQFSPDKNDCRHSMAIYLADDSADMSRLEKEIEEIINPTLTAQCQNS